MSVGKGSGEKMSFKTRMEDPVRHANHRFRSRVGAWQWRRVLKTVISLELIYRQIVDALKRTSDETTPTCKKRTFFKFWWDQDLDELKSRSVVSCNIWKAAGRPRSGPIFRNYRRDKSAYRYGIRSKRISDTEVYTNEVSK